MLLIMILIKKILFFFFFFLLFYKIDIHLTNSTFMNIHNIKKGNCGGVLYISSNINMEILNTKFLSNVASYGGALYVYSKINNILLY